MVISLSLKIIQPCEIFANFYLYAILELKANDLNKMTISTKLKLSLHKINNTQIIIFIFCFSGVMKYV